MFVLDTYVRAWYTWDLCLCWILVLNTYVCDGYLCLCWLFMFVMISVMYICDICDVYVISFVVWMEYKKQIKKRFLYWCPYFVLAPRCYPYFYFVLSFPPTRANWSQGDTSTPFTSVFRPRAWQWGPPKTFPNLILNQTAASCSLVGQHAPSGRISSPSPKHLFSLTPRRGGLLALCAGY